MKYLENLKNIHWHDLEDSVGSRIFRRGERYFKEVRVKNLSICKENSPPIFQNFGRVQPPKTRTENVWYDYLLAT